MDIKYWAGFFDGAGSIQQTKIGQIVVRVSQSRIALRRFQQEWGGKIYGGRNGDALVNLNQDEYGRFLRAVLPHLGWASWRAQRVIDYLERKQAHGGPKYGKNALGPGNLFAEEFN